MCVPQLDYSHICTLGGVIIPKAKPTAVHLHRIEFSTKEREYLETLQTTQSLKNLAYAGSAIGATAVGYLGYKTLHQWLISEEPSVLNILNGRGRDKVVEIAKEEGILSALWKVATTPTLAGIFG